MQSVTPPKQEWGLVLGKLEALQKQLTQVLQQQERLMIQVAFNQAEKTLGTDDTSLNVAVIDPLGSDPASQCEVLPMPSANTTERSQWSVRFTNTCVVDEQENDKERDNEGKQTKREHGDAAFQSQLERTGCNDIPPMVLRRRDTMESNQSSSSGYFVKVTKSSKGRVSCLQEMEEAELRNILQANKSLKSMQREISLDLRSRIGERAASFKYIRKLNKIRDAKSIELLVDSCIGVVICLNSLFLGFSMDAESASTGGYLVAELVFTAIFLGEVILKVKLHGFHQQYCGKEWISNTFDLTIISIDSIHLFLLVAFSGYSSTTSTFNASIFRIVRLLRLARILRILRSQVFKDLLSMIQGMMGGLSTLLWAVAFFVIFIYIVALVFRDTLGREEGSGEDDEDAKMVKMYFATVPTSMFTMFRCSFGECSTKFGTPLSQHITETHGRFWSLIYSVFLFIVVIGLFNVISAIFVESTMSSAAQLASKTKQERLDNNKRWAENVVTLLSSLLEIARPGMEGLEDLAQGSYTDEMLSEMIQMTFPRQVIDEVVHKNERALHALTRLDIDPSDHKYLSDILDPANTGSVSVPTLVDGLKRLRGEPRRSDIITVDLMIRSSQKKIDDIWRWTKEILRNNSNSQEI